MLSDWWPGLEEFFIPGEEILIARSASDTLDALMLSDAEIARIGARGRERILEEHTSERRAADLLAAVSIRRGSDRADARPMMEI
jgi:spore maturation protein CgeB